MMKTLKLFLLILIPIFSLKVSAQQKGYYRSPAIHGTTVIFTAEGDLWKYDLKTGHAFRLTTSHGMEIHSSISPDGKNVAFVGQYEGPSEVYVMPIEGGTPGRLTWEEGSPIVYQWTKDGRIIYSTNSYSTIPNAQLVIVNPETLNTEQVQLSQADQATYDQNGIMFFTRLREQSSHTKRYKGGTAQAIWRYDGKNEAEPLTSDYPGTSKNPMYYNDRIYFLTDRDGTMNIWSMNTDGSGLIQHTKSKGWDLADADLYEDKIVCQKGADIMLYNIVSDSSEILDISLMSDFDQRRTQWISDPKSLITSINISYKGDQLVITSRGRVFSVPPEAFRWSEVTRKYGVRYKNAAYSDEKNNILVLSDESGEFELWKADNYGFTAPEQITNGSKNLIVGFEASPDGNYIVFNEKDNMLKMYSAKEKTVTTIDENDFGFGGPFAWSPDSRWMAYTDVADNQLQFLCLYDIKSGNSFQVTSDRFSSYHPSFSRDGKWLFFISDRTFNTKVRSPWGERQPEPYYDKTANLYALALTPDEIFPLSVENELSPVAQDTTKKTNDRSKTNSETKKPTTVNIEISGLPQRLYMVPGKSADISDFGMADEWLYWTERNVSENKTELKALKITRKKDNEPVQIATDITSFKLSGNGKKILIRDKNGIMVLNADGTKSDAKKSSVNLAKWAFTIDPMEDWNQMFNDAWRMERDYFYDRNMHGVDWKGVYDQYKPLVARVTDRYELDDLLAQMISELSALHMFVYGGEKRTSKDNYQNGFLGAKLTRDENKGGYVIDHIFRSDPDIPSDLSPLAKPGLKIMEGDVIVAINGVSTLTVPHINQLLVNKADLQARLKLKNANGKLYEEMVIPISSNTFSNLRYSEWEYSRRLKVDSISKSKIGYLHLRAMSGNDYDEFVKTFYPAITKEGIIIDVRHNRGGNIDSWILEKLIRKAWFYWAPRVGIPTPNMQFAYTGHLVVLMDEITASDGEAFSEGFRRLGLGKLIGTRTWGGEIWLSSGNRLVDNGIATAAETGVYSPDGEWLIEGWGVEPDIKVDNLPHESFLGKDAQLDAGIDYLLKMIKEKPVTIPVIPQYPVKAFDD
jgi:tricorn protease